MQWSEILSEIKRTLKEPSTDGHWSDAEYLRRANIVQRQICRDMECITVVDTTNVSIVNSSTYSKPTNCLKIISVMYGDTKLYEIDKTSLDIGTMETNLENPWQDTSGTPTNFYQTQDSIVLYPKPDTASDVISITYYSQADDLVDLTDIPFNSITYLNDAHNLIILGVVYRCLMEEKDVFYREYKQEFMEEISKLKLNLKKKTNMLQSFSLIGRKSFKNTSPLPILGDV